MSHILLHLPAALSTLLRRSRPSDALFDADLIPPNWQAIEPRWDCSVCRGTTAAEILPDGFRCLKCGTEICTTDA